MTTAPRHFPAIDGLRALAVLSVVIFHIDPAWVPGGFVGVDVFFVISGFVVAHSVYETSDVRFSTFFLAFYRRRLARILPAISVYVAVVATLGAIFIPPSAASNHIEITGAASLFGASNVVLLLRAGDYFATSSEYNSFTHTWSLAVEEQYYVIFPFIAYVLIVRRNAANHARTAMLATLYAVCVASLVAAAYFTVEWRTFAFYMLPTRFWELGLGLLLRVHLASRRAAPNPAGQIIGTLAAASLLASFWWTPVDGFPFPGALWACASTATIIACLWLFPGTRIDRWLRTRLPRFFGRISYSLYLWHWGVIVLMRWTVGIEGLVRQAIAVALMLVLAIASYRLVEQPLRYDRRIRQWGTLPFFAAFSLAGVAIAGTCIQLKAHKGKINVTASNNAMIWSPYIWRGDRSGACAVTVSHTSFAGGARIDFTPVCQRASDARLFVMGDSHAGAYTRMMHMVSGSAPRPVSLYTMGGCRLLEVDRRTLAPGCATFQSAFVKQFMNDARPGDTLFLAGLYTRRYRDAWGVPEARAEIIASGQPAGPGERARSKATLQAITDRGVNVILEAPKPTIPTALFRCADWFNRVNGYCNRGWEVPREDMVQRGSIQRDQLIRLAHDNAGVTIWDPLPLLCTTRQCGGFRNGHPLYFDTDHLSGYGNELLFDGFMQALGRHHTRPASRQVDPSSGA